MVLTPHEIALSSPTVSYSIGFYIADDSGAWVDFTAYISRKTDRLASLGSISHVVERDFGVLQSTIQPVTLDDTDGFFRRPFPYGSVDGLRTVGGAVASFSNSKNGSVSIIDRHKCKITYIFQGPGGKSQEVTVGVFLIDDVDRDPIKGQVDLSLVSLAQPLIEADASKVRDGQTWYQNRSAKFLVQELLKTAHVEANGGLPNSWIFEDVVSIPTVDGSLATSHFGPPPEWDGTTWQRKGKRATAMCYGTVGSFSGHLWIAIEDEIWRMEVATEKWTSVVTGLTSTLPIYYMTSHNSKLFCFGVADEAGNVSGVGTYLTSGRIIRVTESGGVFTAATLLDISSLYSGRAMHRYCSVNMDPGPGIGGLGQITGAGSDAGENQALPFSQIQMIVHSSLVFGVGSVKATDIWDDVSGGPDVGGAVDISRSRSHYSWRYDSIGFEEHWMRFWYGTKLCVVHSGLSSAADGYMVYFTTTFGATSPTPTVTINFYNLTTGATVSATVNSAVGHLPHALAVYDNGAFENSYMVATMDWDSAGGTQPTAGNRNDRSTCRLYSGTVASATTSVQKHWMGGTSLDTDTLGGTFNQDDGNRYWVVLEMVYADIGGAFPRLTASIFNRSTLSHGIHNDVLNVPLSGSEFESFISRQSGQIKGLSVRADQQGVIFAYGSGSGQALQISAAGTITALDFGTPCVFDEYELLSGLVVSDDSSVVWGVSAPTSYWQSQGGWAQGKYYLFQIRNQITDRIEVADFDGLNAWEAIKQICQAVDCVAGFSVNGSFFFRKRPRTQLSAATYTVGDSVAHGVDNDINRISWGSGKDEIFNIVSITPHAGEVVEGQAEMRMATRNPNAANTAGKTKQPAIVDFQADIRTSDKKVVRAVCVVGGRTNDGLSRWKYQITPTEVTVRLVEVGGISAIETGFSISSLYGGHHILQLNDPSGVQVDDFIVASNPDTGEHSIRRIVSVNGDSLGVTINSNFGFALPEKAELIIIKRFVITSGSSQSEWSDLGVTYISPTGGAAGTTISVHSARDLSKGTVVRLFGVVGDYRITSIAYGATEDILTVAPNVLVHSAGIRVDAYWSPPGFPVSNGIPSEIGSTGVFIKFEDPPNGTAEVDWTQTFIVNDTITIHCEGMRSVALEHAKQTVYLATSVQKHGRREYNNIENRFIGRRMAIKVAQYIGSYHQWPKATIEVESRLRPDIDVLSPNGGLAEIDVYSPLAFPMRDGFKERCTIREITNTLHTRKTVLVLKAINPY